MINKISIQNVECCQIFRKRQITQINSEKIDLSEISRYIVEAWVQNSQKQPLAIIEPSEAKI